MSARAGLVMNPDAKVKMRGVQVGKVASIEAARRHGRAAPGDGSVAAAPDSGQCAVDITSSTVFGAKFVQFVPPAQQSAKRMHAGQVIQGQPVTVEINTVFQQLVSVLTS